MSSYWDIFLSGYKGYASYLWTEITNPSWNNYFYWLLLVSAFFFLLEIAVPWRKKQKLLRKDFWLDFFYMFFNFFLFSLIIYNAASDVIVEFINNGIQWITSFDLQASNPMRNWPMWSILLVGFILRDFVQWWVHRLLHRVAFLWEFHKVHHSIEQMGFAAHLRYHWMETIVYRFFEYLPLALLGIGLHDFFIIHIFTLAVGHFNHSNVTVSGYVTSGILGALIGVAVATSSFDITLLLESGLSAKILTTLGITAAFVIAIGPWMKKLFNSPEMHIWHHAYDLPEEKRYGVNFGLSLAIWDYIWGTAHVPSDGAEIRLGFEGIEEFPEDFGHQMVHGWKK